jgi:hypothetical protein
VAKVGFDRKVVARALVLAALLCWPMFAFGRAGLYFDTAGYLSGGEKIVEFVATKLHPPHASAPPVTTSAAPLKAAPPTEADSAATKATRSIPYSLLVYLLSGPGQTMGLLVLFQALATGFTVTLFLRAFGVSRLVHWATAALLVVASPVAWVTCFAMPDIFAGLIILAITLLAFAADRLTRAAQVALCAICALGISSHPSHIALALLLIPLAFVLSVAFGRRTGRLSRIWLVGAALAGVAAVLVTSAVGFGQLSLAPKHLPFVLARSIADGPGRWYLERHCATEHYVVCQVYQPQAVQSSNDFLFGPQSVTRRATPAQMDQIRREEMGIVIRATATYPLAQLRASLGGIGHQLMTFGVDDVWFNGKLVRTPDGILKLVWDRAPPVAARAVADVAAIATALLSLAWVLIGIRRTHADVRMAILFVLCAITINAGVCAVLSAPANRYQSRVIWLVTLAAAVVPGSAVRLLPRRPLAKQ